MAEPIIKNKRYPKRVTFPQGKQRNLLSKMQDQLNLNLKEFAKIAGISVRSMIDWKREKFSMSLPALKRLCRKTRIPLPKNIKIKDSFWYVNKGAKIGGVTMYKRYRRVGGDPEYRKKRWREWWEKEGRYRKDLITAVTKPIKKPAFSSKLAELIGILLGDGGITRRQVTITLNKYDDKEYANYVRNLFVKLFGVIPSVHKRQNASIISIVISRRELVKFLVENGLKIGGKVRQQVRVPYWIEKSEFFTKSCLRGLFDTDGCFYLDKHYYKDRIYYNCAMNFSNRSLPILFFFKTKLEQFGFHPTRNKKFNVSLRKENEIIRYFQKIGSFNPKHLNKYRDYLNRIRGGVG